MNAASAAGQQARPTQPPVRRGAARPAPDPNPELAHLDLAALRGYRSQLTTEEGRVSYWRRILQARIDVVNAVAEGNPSVDNLREVLTGLPVRSGRKALLELVDSDELPPLPELPSLWVRDPTSGDAAANAELLVGLEEAERRLSEYRSALLTRIEAATAELIARYHADPSTCFVALPSR